MYLTVRKRDHNKPTQFNPLLVFLSPSVGISTVCALPLNCATQNAPVRKTCLLLVKLPLLMSTTPPPLIKIVIQSNLHPSMEMLHKFHGGKAKCIVTS
jgi:hypothetical protein